MANSYVESLDIPCTNCQEAFRADIWLIVDVKERPDLAETIRKGTLHLLTCPHCSSKDTIPIVPILLYCPGKAKPIIFSPRDETNREQVQADVSWLVEHLLNSLDEDWDDKWIEDGIPLYPRASLPAYMDFGREEEEGGGGRVPPIPQQFKSDVQEAVIFKHRFEQNGEREALDRAVEAWERIYKNPDFSSADPVFRSSVLCLGGGDYFQRYLAARHIEDLARALERIEQAITLLPPNSGYLPIHLNELGRVLNAFYRQTEDVDYLERAAQKFDQSLSLIPTTAPERAGILINAAGCLTTRYKRTGKADDLERAISLYREAAEKIAPDEPERIKLCEGLGSALHDRYDLYQKTADLEAAIELFTRLIEDRSLASGDLASVLNRRGSALLARYNDAGASEDIEAAVSDFKQAIERDAPDSNKLVDYLNDLGTGLQGLYARKGNPADLEEAIQAWERAVKLPHVSPSRSTMSLYNLGLGLMDRYLHMGDLADLDQAIQTLKRTAEQTSANSIHLPNRRAAVGTALLQRFNHNDEAADLDSAIEFLEESVAHTPQHARVMRYHLSSLGSGLLRRYHKAGELSDLDRAIQFLEDAAERVPTDAPQRGNTLGGLAAALLERAQKLEDEAELDRAIQLLEQAVSLAQSGSPTLIGCRNNLAVALRTRSNWSGTLADRERAVNYFRQSAREGLEAAPAHALHGAREWGDGAFQRREWAEAAEAYEFARKAGERLVQSQLGRRGKELWLSEIQGVAANSAYAEAKLNNLKGAVVVLERGRATLLAERLEQNQSNLAVLEGTSPALFERYKRAVERLAWIEGQAGITGELSVRHDLAAEARTLRAELGTVVERIRRVRGFESFLTLPTYDDVHAALTGQTGGTGLVYLATTTQGSIALIVGTHGFESVWLDFTQTDLGQLLAKFDGDKLIGGYLPGQFSNVEWLEESLAELLPLLGERVMGSVAGRLHALGVELAFLIPAGTLGLLPLHASTYTVRDKTVSFIDEFTACYATGAGALSALQDNVHSREGRKRLLAGVGNPLPSAQPLQAAQAELEEVATLFSEDASQPLYAEEATREALLEVLPKATYLHFACHGLFKIAEPLESSLELAGQTSLTLRDLLHGTAKPDSARLAVLSACQSAVSDFRHLPDEFVGFPAAFLQAGVPGVVATLWPINDYSTALLMIRFYEYHLRGDVAAGEYPMPPAVALKRAQLWLRDVTNEELGKLFRRFKQAAPDAPAQPRMSYTLAREKFREYTLRNPDERPFSHPFYWAAFAFYGV